MVENDNSGANGFGPLPEEYSIPIQLVERWLQLPEQNYIEVKLSRADFDVLFNSLDKTLKAFANFQSAMIDWTNGNVAGSNKLNHEARRLMLESSSAWRRFFAAVMASATQVK